MAAWDALQADEAAVLVDVRTMEEWSFVGIADLTSLGKQALLVEWARLPGMAVNDRFTSELSEQLAGTAPARIYFLCRSGVRSLNAARATAEAFSATGQTVECVNIAGGFEGDLDSQAHRGNKNGWKKLGLPWRQT